jgi:transposase
MRGRRDPQPKMFFAIDVERRIRADHPLRPVKRAVDRILAGLGDRFAAAYSEIGRPSVPPETLLKALLLMALYSVRSERRLVERIDTDLLFRWFLDLDPAQEVFDATAFSHNRPRLDAHGLTAAFFDAVLKEAIDAGLTSDDHFSVDGTLIESCASIKSFRPKAESDEKSDGGDPEDRSDSNGFKSRNAEIDFHGQKRTNESHRSRTDPEARLYRKSAGQEAKLSHLGHAIAENRNGLIMAIEVGEASGTAERNAATAMLDRLAERQGVRPKTLGADKGYDAGEFYLELERRGVEPHVAVIGTPPADLRHVRASRRAEFEARLRMKERLASATYRVSQRCRKKVEECFGWLKTIGGLARSRWPKRWKLKQQLELAAAAFNLVRMRSLAAI